MPCLDSPEYYIMYGKKLSLKPALPVLILLKIKRLALFFKILYILLLQHQLSASETLVWLVGLC